MTDPDPRAAVTPYTPPTEPVTVLPYIGPRDTVFEQVLNALTAGTIRRHDPPTDLPDGQVLVLAYPVPTTPDAPTTVGTHRFGDWPLYWLAALAVPTLACLAVAVYLFAVGLHAVAVWGVANALSIGVGVLVVFVCVLVFLTTLAKARHGHHPDRGRYR